MSLLRLHSPDSQAPSELPIEFGPLMQFPRDPIACMNRIHSRHGRIAALQQATSRIVFAFGPQFNQQVLSDPATFHSKFFSIRGPKQSAQRRLTSGLLSMNGETHRRNRRLIMEPFSKRSIANYHQQLVQTTHDLLSPWRPGQVRDLFQDMTRFMLQVTSSLLFGFDQSDLALRIGEMTERWVSMNHQLGLGALVPNDTFTAKYESLLQQADALESLILEMIRLRRASRNSGQDVLSILIQAHDEQGGLTNEELVGQAAILFAAAHLTTANTLTWTLFLLAQHPRIMQALHQELTIQLRGRSPTPDQLDSLPVTHRVIKESMRVMPASSYSQRVSAAPARLGPFGIARGTTIIFSPYMTHHLPELYGEPNRFRPDRWLDINPTAYEYLPFAAGPRMCLGGPLAMTTLKVALPTILQRFRLTLVPQAEICGRVTSTMLTPTTPVPIIVDHHNGQFQSQPVRGNIHDLVELPAPELIGAPTSSHAA